MMVKYVQVMRERSGYLECRSFVLSDSQDAVASPAAAVRRPFEPQGLFCLGSLVDCLRFPIFDQMLEWYSNLGAVQCWLSQVSGSKGSPLFLLGRTLLAWLR